MIDKVSKKECVLCGACIQKCPKNCISFSKEYYSFDYPVINNEVCVRCNLCEKVCPAIKEQESITPVQFFAAKHRKEEILKISSSGGVFYALAEYILSIGGHVCGAAFDENFEVKHIVISEKQQINKLCGSKYIQSDINDCFVKIRVLLKEGKTVLFSGSPCQTAALSAFLGKQYDNLLMMDFICHGIVSAKVFAEYKKYLEMTYHGKIVNFQFRNKDNGWLFSGPYVEFDNGRVYNSPLNKDLYMQGYFNNLNLKEACYTCKYKNYRSMSDITIGDFWGIEKKYPDFYDFNGNSVVVTNTLKGRQFIEKVNNLLELLEVDKEAILAENEGLEKAFSCNPLREEYFLICSHKGYIRPLKKYLKKPLWKKIKGKIVRLIKNG